MFEKTINFLLENACVSIRYLVNWDMLKTSINDPMMQNMQTEILQQKTVQKYLSKQHSDGWFGDELHGGNGMDSIIGSLLMYGVEADSPYIQKAIKALLTPEIAEKHKNYFAGGDALDFDGRGGNRSVTAGILVKAHVPESTPLLAEEIQIAFNHLSGALEHKSIEDFTKKGAKYRYYKPCVKFPGGNHIYILANTHNWQTAESLQTAKAAMTHCYSLMKDVGYIMFRKPKEYGGSYVGPFNYDWNSLNNIDMTDFQNIVNNQYHFAFGFWLRNLIEHPEWVLQTTQSYEFLAELLEEDKLMKIIPDNTKEGFRHLLGIEPYWKNKTAVNCDLTFAVLKTCWPVLAK
ncbi:MAG: hypothetical protein VB118_08940 [Oscillospiraceae bacterium]|nr:hypothetical protein [Oscillospiraceae bacterium]